MSINPLNICQVNDYDVKGGAEKISLNLHLAYLEKKYESNLIVGRKYFRYNNTYEVFSSPILIRNNIFDIFQRQHFFSENKFGQILIRLLKSSSSKDSRYYLINGMDDYDQPSMGKLLNKLIINPDILHLHNLHGNYFNLNELPELSKEIPTLLTLHDAWLLTGSCGHSMNCDNWITGCNNCNPKIVPSHYRRYGAPKNWKFKNRIFEVSNLFFTTPSQWLMNQVQKSSLQPAIVDCKVIHNGIDMEIFRIGDKGRVRKQLNLPNDAIILLFIANRARDNPSKDFPTLIKAVTHLARRKSRDKIIFLVIGDNHTEEKHGSLTIVYIPFMNDEKTLVKYYQASDIYIHAAKADTFPTTIIEAMSCGLPIIATDIGGIPEQIQNDYSGFLIKPEDYKSFANSIEYLLEDKDLRDKIGRNGSEEANNRFNFTDQVNNYLDYYRYILKKV